MSIKKQAISGVKWSFVQQLSVQIINFIVQVVLARLLLPEMFGLIAMVAVFISIGTMLMDSGMTSSLIRTKNPVQADYSTVFITNIVVSVAIYILIFIVAPYIAVFYKENSLIDIIRVLAFGIVIRSFVAIHMAKLTKEMNFRLQMRLQVPSTIISGIVGVVLAYMGYGVWSLVLMNLSQAVLIAIQAWLFISWKPSFVFDKERFKYHLKFGYKLTLSGLLHAIYNDSYKIVIGKFFSPVQVGYFSQAETMRLFPATQIGTVVNKVSYPLFSKIESDKQLKLAYKSLLKVILFFMIPLMLSLILIAEEGFLFLFGEKWLPAVPYFQILALASIFGPISSYCLNILQVKGRSDIYLYLEIVKKAVGLLFIIVGIQYGILGLVIALTIFSISTYLVDMHYSGRVIEYGVLEQIKDVYKLLLFGVGIFLIMLWFKLEYVQHINSNLMICLTFSCLFFFFFFVLVLIFDREVIMILKNIKN